MSRPVRNFSDAPEVVTPEIDDVESIFVTYQERFKRQTGTLQIDPVETESRNFPPPPLPLPSTPATPATPTTASPKPPASTYLGEEKSSFERRRSLGILTTLIVAFVAFLIGGGIGGGVGGALLVKEKNRLCPSSAAVTISSPSPSTSAGTSILDIAGCPAIMTSQAWNSTTSGKRFIRACYKDTVGVSPDQNIVIGQQAFSTLDGCLNACASMEKCVAATWYIFSVTTPSKNAVCFFKGSVGVQSAQAEGDSCVTGFLTT
ncbi:hypothetical protein BJ875DRAFT_278722 [Amylocarpus encephaloides]|uniref:Apple domain-containing protein n=1 Tax=Amylocarpus encephaloides TaxID=45428 RepID=A0A9P7YLM0_9HELO|nr:hypothetical protein BJ875DRAFT_278722 [Amylocarpus encephaloides]